MRYIASNEVCFSAAEIAEKFKETSGIELHPTNVGNAAKKLGLDYIEVEVEPVPGQTWSKPQKRYSELDMPAIFVELRELANNRAKYL